jgi:hypothetical protein
VDSVQVRGGRRRAVGAGPVLAVVVTAVVALAGCGGGSSKAKTTPTSNAASSASGTGSGANRQALQAYRTCLSQHGVTGFGGFDGRRRGANGTPPSTSTPPTSRAPLTAAQRAKLQAAQQACQSQLPKGFAQQRQQDLAAYRSCMSDHGVKLPANDGTGLGGGFAGVNRNDPAFQAANKICAPLLPNGGRFGGRGGNGSTSSTNAPSAAGVRTRSTV